MSALVRIAGSGSPVKIIFIRLPRLRLGAISATQRWLGHGNTLKCDEHRVRFSLDARERRWDFVPSENETGAKAEANGQSDGLYDENCNWRWDIGNDLLLATPSTDHQRIGSRSSWSPVRPASSEGDCPAAECALGDRNR